MANLAERQEFQQRRDRFITAALDCVTRPEITNADDLHYAKICNYLSLDKKFEEMFGKLVPFTNAAPQLQKEGRQEILVAFAWYVFRRLANEV